MSRHSDSSDCKSNSPKVSEIIDGFIAIISGHGNSEGLILPNGETFKYLTFQELFDNENFNGLKGYPKLYIIDTCRRKINNSNDKKGPIDIINDNKIGKWVSNLSDICYFYATTDNDFAYLDNENGSHLISGLCKYLKESKEKNKTSLYYISLKVKNYVNQISNGKQTSEVVDRLDYDIIFD